MHNRLAINSVNDRRMSSYPLISAKCEMLDKLNVLAYFKLRIGSVVKLVSRLIQNLLNENISKKFIQIFSSVFRNICFALQKDLAHNLLQ